ncbi:hypothetical protein [Caulobacter segnis]|uniref:Uncharacterized protein n=1 Tax=Caulobacter segnis TaxID=88688 RepID=A0A2W5VD86_9CAUL|nr:hypothetical protein [Caulobacter segnis]PZR36487.1 MAG: hypothetical protein DI526_03360 [Caulobacter segnis]
MTIYSEARAAAIRLLAPVGSNPDAAGQVATLTYQPAGVYDPTTGGVTSPAPVVQTISGVEKAIKVDRVNGTTILAGDSEFVMSPVTTSGADVQLPDDLPLQATLELADGTVKAVVGPLQPKRPAGLLISATLQLRGAS